MLRYADLDVSFDDREVWKTDFTDINKGPKWSHIVEANNKLAETKEKVKRDLIDKISIAVDSAQTDEQIGLNLTPLFETLNKGFFVSDSINEEMLLNKANRNTLQKKLQGWCKQLNFNVPAIKSRPGIKIYHNKLRNVPCVIVSAGPSLQNAIHKLKALKGKAVIMALGTSFRSCINRQIIPDFVNAHDANGPDLKAGTGGGPKFFKGAYARETVALFVNYIYPGTIQAYDGPICFYYVEDPGVAAYRTMALACESPERPDGSFLESSIIGGSSVAHTALYAAINFGCDPITYVGLDLSYPEMTRSHFESDNMKDVRKKRLIDIMGVNGRKLKTDLSFYSYATVLNRMVPFMQVMKKVELFNSSENVDGTPAGIVHYGLKPMKFDDWIDTYAGSSRPEINSILSEYNKYKR